MAKHYKIKRYKKTGGHTYKARPHPLTVLLCIVLVGGLVYLGIVIYQPVYDFVMSIGQDSADDAGMAQSGDPAVSAEPPVASQPDPDPEPEPPQTVNGLTAVFMPFDIAADAAQAKAFIDRLDSATNAVMVEIKNSQGQLLYDTKVARALEWEAVSDKLIDLSGIAAMLREKDKHLIVRMHAFSDPIAARGDRELNAIKYQNSDMLWLDNYADRGGKPWLNPYVPEVRSYLIEVATEAVGIGAAMVVMDSVRFPDDMTGSASFGA
ncbi:MAG: putative glycoside hydrolase, partial [Oscillospiraceae bacterium]|nr:putative glycoside hydrolase [Oscillospiraceae bacterium]